MKRVLVKIQIVDDALDNRVNTIELAAYQYHLCQNTTEAEINAKEIESLLEDFGFTKVT